jgi:hypothetical protein
VIRKDLAELEKTGQGKGFQPSKGWQPLKFLCLAGSSYGENLYNQNDPECYSDRIRVDTTLPYIHQTQFPMLRFLKQIALFLIIVSCCTCSMQGDTSKVNAKPAEQQKGILVYSEQIKLITSIIGTLSVIIAVLTFATNVRSKETENKRNQAKLIKEHLGELSANIYLLEWTTITKSHISIVVSKVMDKVRALLKDPNDKNEIEQIL